MAAGRRAKWRSWAWALIGALPLAGCTYFSVAGPEAQRKRDYGTGEVFDLAADGFQFRKDTRSWRSMQRENIVMQKYDYSCGSAALATLQRYYFEDPVDEQVVLKVIFLRLSLAQDPKAELKDRFENGFSMLDLFNAAKDMKYQAAVVKIPFDKLAELQSPSIVRIEKHQFKHFVVFRGVHDQTVYLADPMRGNVRLSADEFLKQWSGEVLVLGKAGFGLPKEHPLAVRVDGPARPELEFARQALFPIHR
ncbi:MAG: C39 family peptidase [Pirellulaceae bacterium]|nr:C39 family peptidase [Pirellulaceae bacterium]